jgi:hypothetical protein
MKILRTSMLMLALLAAVASAATPADVTLKADGGEPIPTCAPSKKACPIMW